jgi:hypothetical protein
MLHGALFHDHIFCLNRPVVVCRPVGIDDQTVRHVVQAIYSGETELSRTAPLMVERILKPDVFNFVLSVSVLRSTEAVLDDTFYWPVPLGTAVRQPIKMTPLIIPKVMNRVDDSEFNIPTGCDST